MQTEGHLLTGFGVFWGVLLLIVLLGCAQGLRNGIEDQFGAAADNVYIWRANVAQIPYRGLNAGRWIGMDNDDVRALKKRVPGIKIAVGINNLGRELPQFVSRNHEYGSYLVQGSHLEIAEMSGFSMAQGRFFNGLDNRERRKVAVIGSRVYEQLFPLRDDAIGASIKISGISFTVVGVFEPSAIGDQARKDAGLVFLPNETLRNCFNQEGWIDLIRMSPQKGVHSSVIEKEAIDFLKDRHNISPQDIGVYGSYNTQKEFDKYMALFSGMAAFSWFIAIGTIFSGVIGVGNIMLIFVKERNQEIGLRKALGATIVSIAVMVVEEAIFLTSLSGLLGLLAGKLLLNFINYLCMLFSVNAEVFHNPTVNNDTCVIALVVLIICGTLTALIPAVSAAKINPIVALKDE
ncbi:ABC transporter permease [Rugamonas sp. DEMB1]|uniref:ABC transporter permease n=1 Tax=Rugamonas sp. DEMB1 TaxID=3039386 RepID=UPI0024494CE1|nr:ABC transporter permease [Rugamonas sp. DEMB1]WGG53440.1 ABC transporter permease [Rugamonas sp. DEMB1]